MKIAHHSSIRSLALLLFSVLLLFSCSKKNHGKPVSQEALRNDFLQWERFLQHQDPQTRASSSAFYSEQAGAPDIVFAYEAAFSRPETVDQILDRIHDGGTLVTGLHTSASPSESLLLKRLLEEAYADEDTFIETTSERRDRLFAEGEKPSFSDSRITCQLRAYQDWLPDERRMELPTGSIRFRQGLLCSRPLPATIRSFGTKNGAVLLLFQLGEGQVLFFSDLAPFTWQGMTDADVIMPSHKPKDFELEAAAMLFPWLQTLPEAPRLLCCRTRYAAGVPLIYAWLAGPGLPCTISVLLLALAFVWRLTRRFGPIVPQEQQLSRRSLAEHLKGCADYTAQPAVLPMLLRQLMTRTREAWCRRHPSLESAAIDEAMAAHAGMDPHELGELARGFTRDFTRALSLIRKLRRF